MDRLAAFLYGIVVSLVGLIVNPLVIAPLGGAITLLAAIAWIREHWPGTDLRVLGSLHYRR